MSTVMLTSGGLDSTLMSVLAKELGQVTYPLFINYGQRSKNREWAACKNVHRNLGLPKPVKVDVAGIGKLIPCGLTDPSLDVYEDAFLPGRNLFFLLLGASYAFKTNSDAVAIGLLNDKFSIFPDQTKEFIRLAETAIYQTLGRRITLVTPLMSFTKQEVIVLARKKGVSGTYSCHSGAEKPCRKCISCKEFQ